ncbi:SusC/RagA family TonB-linked outer membrane protein [Bacteroidales bacterium]|nr:SusC/RagA family TonB-linked outer membrane protein [Bacteroidales bacterium]
MNFKNCKAKKILLMPVFFALFLPQIETFARDGKDKSPNYTAEYQQVNTKNVKGLVVDESGMSIPGVSVVVKGTSIGTVTDIDGNYSINTSDNMILSFHSIGYLVQEIKIGTKSTINLTLKEDTKTLDEIVVVGYTTQRKADLTGAVSSVKLDNLNDLAVSGISSALQGRMSGVTVLQSSGAPGSGTTVRIRGLGTIGNNDPLYVIDGMPADNMNDLNPSDIERIDVLKDAASAAIYGSRAANGVVIIQTKKGVKSDKVNIAFNTYQGVASPNKKINLLDASQRNLVHIEAYENAYKYDGLTKPDKTPEYYFSDYAKVSRTNWQDEVLQDAYQANYDLTLSGGSETAKYTIMGAHLNQDGILKKSGFERTTFRVNTELLLSKNLKVGENLMITNSKQKIVDDMGPAGALSSALQYDPSVPVFQEDGSYSGSGELGIDLRNPVSIVDRADRARGRNRIFGNAYAELTLLKGLSLKTDFGYDWSKWQDKWFVMRVPEAGRSRNTNEMTQRDWESTRWINTTSLKYDATYNNHRIMGLVGTSYESFDMNFTNVRGTGFISEEKSQRYMESATNIAWSTGGREEWALQSYFTRLDYSLADRYLLSANFRTDGSSKFSKDNRWGYFPSLSAGWRISEEGFFKEVKQTIDNLKLRASWGKLGNQNIYSNYPTFVKVNNTTDNDGYNVAFGSGESLTFGRYEASIANKDIKWEVTNQTDIGIDISLLHKLELGFDYYNKETSDVLVQVPIPALSGVTQEPWKNAAKVQNRGFEVSIGYRTKINELSINLYGNLGHVKNKVLSLGSDNNEIFHSSYRGTNITRSFVGEPIVHFYGYKNGGVFKSQTEIDNYVDDKGNKIQANAKPGDLKFLDINNDGQIDDKDKTKIGSGFPDLTYGLGLDMNYKGFDFAFFFQGVAGYDIFNALKYEGMFVSGGYNQFAQILDRFHSENNPDGNLPRLTVRDVNDNRRMSDYYIDKGDYLRLKNLSIGYTFNKNISQKLNIQKLRIFTTMQNLLTFTKYKGFDPEFGETFINNDDQNGISEIGVDRGQFPQPKTFIVGLNINF